MRKLSRVLVTGGCGFIGSNFIRYLFSRTDFHGVVVNADALTYAGNLLSLADVERRYGGTRYFFQKVDIRDFESVARLVAEQDIDAVVHFAAESHVDRSIAGPAAFISTNVNGTFNLLEAARASWKERTDVLFHHVSTDEVFGSLGDDGRFTETTRYDPRSPYSASKAASDHIASAYHHTYGLPLTLSNCSNNYGPYQFPEKLIPVMIFNALAGKPLPVYGDGANVRDWLYVEDHCSGIWAIMTNGRAGESYNIGGDSERRNIDLVHLLCRTIATAVGRETAEYERLITFVKDRPGHDRRYAIDCQKIKQQLGWKQAVDLEAGLARTVRWYLDNEQWVRAVQGRDYQDWMRRNYVGR